MGQTDCAIGVAGIDAILDYEGKKDTFGKTLSVTEIAIVDELCSAAELVMGKTLHRPAVIIRNYKHDSSKGSMKSLIRPDSEDMFK
jgi:coenzyme F420-0:L-glutamate ligase/coenzyme F420-1:gamma-L-glutamate ligase